MKAFDVSFLLLRRRKTLSLALFLVIVLATLCCGLFFRLYKLAATRVPLWPQGVAAVMGSKSGQLEIVLSTLNAEGEFPGFIPEALVAPLSGNKKIEFEDGTLSQNEYQIDAAIPLTWVAQIKGNRVLSIVADFWNANTAIHAPPFEQGGLPEQTYDIVVGHDAAQQNLLQVGSIVHPSLVSDAQLEKGGIDFKVVGILSTSGTVWDRVYFVIPQAGRELLRESFRKGVLVEPLWHEKSIHAILISLREENFSRFQSFIEGRTVAQIASVRKTTQLLRRLSGGLADLAFIFVGLIGLLAAIALIAFQAGRSAQIEEFLNSLRLLGFSARFLASSLAWEILFCGVSGVFVAAAVEQPLFRLMRIQFSKSLPDENLVHSAWYSSWPIWLGVLLAFTFLNFLMGFKANRTFQQSKETRSVRVV